MQFDAGADAWTGAGAIFSFQNTLHLRTELFWLSCTCSVQRGASVLQSALVQLQQQGQFGEKTERHAVRRPNLSLLFPACCLTHFGRDGQSGRSWSENGKKRNDSAGKQTVARCGAISAAEGPQMQLFACACGSHFSLTKGHLSPNSSHSDLPCSRRLGLRPSCAFVSCQCDCLKVWTQRNKHRFAYSGKKKNASVDRSCHPPHLITIRH